MAPILPKETETLELPEELDILMSTEEELMSDPSHTSSLPPPEVLEDALHNLQITLHPQTQHRATYSTPLGPPVEPTLGLYCPIEGGEYVIDATVRELALRTGAEVVVLDAVQLAAGEWGHFGKAANALQLPNNPLHFPSAPPSLPSSSRSFAAEAEEDSDNGPQGLPHPQMTLTVMASPAMQGRAIMTSSRKPPAPSRIKVFFDTLVNMPSKQDSSSPSSSRTRPRLIYIRDYPTLAPSSAYWYPHLLSAVRQRRRGPISRPSSPVSNPITIIFGMTPSITPSAQVSPPGSSLVNTLLNRMSPQVTPPVPPSKQTRTDWGEDETAEKAREKRLRERLRRWEKGDTSLYDEFSRPSPGPESEVGSDSKPEIILIGAGGNGVPSLPPFLGGLPFLGNKAADSEPKSFFFRTATLVPQARSLELEKRTRIARRREINELTMRMGVGAVGGSLQGESVVDALIPALGQDANPESESSHPVENNIWDAWGNTVEVWANVKKIADRALGSVMSSQPRSEKGSLEPTLVSWAAVHKAWLAHQGARELRKAWLKEVSPLGKPLRQYEEDEEDENSQAGPGADEVIERVKNDTELDSYEHRLLPCIVDSASMTTTFGQVHLPAHTIDSVRTIVSLPLLHPQAFQQGILKEHGMTGCLLFGPPGTGKTLIVRALAKEAGCRMMMVSPSDVMDMYVGEGEKLVKAVFSLARRLSPCVIFLDEIDALFGARMSARESGGAIAHRGVITEFMQEMDGLKSSKEDNIIVIGATNRPFDLDDAVLRRLPRRLLVDLPGEKEREEILKILLRDEQLATDVDTKDLARKTDSFSGSDLKHLCVSAALDSIKEHVNLPWTVPHEALQQSVVEEVSVQGEDIQSTTTKSNQGASGPITSAANEPLPNQPDRILHLRNFTKALKEITPSSSESLGSLAELRKWNEEFGEGRKDKKRHYVWGKGRFGFTNNHNENKGDGSVAR
ncbi:hypothetical protein AMATHDRAFT_144519 [Amanita thiersii Skay4041]|uniref:AAA+ ATPase domain-containing protein n=1 Tax=Amanita thiersii Skay4041 TaxID=703135 RepID=A0A2A9NSL5_9AGAR|nr:hypothetical protein AMATHDRAFT_144519 [Amanita thiersii Skay4041]